jgi:hypothetical protein
VERKKDLIIAGGYRSIPGKWKSVASIRVKNCAL